MTAESLKLTVYFGESDRAGKHLLSDELVELFERQEVQAAVLMRAVEGFGIKHQLRTDRLLTLSEDLPLVAVAVDDRPRIEALVPRVSDLLGGGLITLERAKVIMYRPHLPEEERPASWPIDITGSWRTVEDNRDSTDA